MCSSMFVPWPEGMWEHFDLSWPSWPAWFSQMPFLTVVDVFLWGVVASSELYCSQSSFQSQMKWLRSAARGHLTWYSSKMLRWPRHSFRCISVHDGKHKGRHRQAEGTFEGADFGRPAESCGDSYLPVMDSNNLLPSTRLGILPGQHHASFAEPFEFTFFSYVSRWGGARVANQESHKRLSKIGSRLKPEILRFLLDRTISVDVAGRDDPDTTVTVQSFLCHYDRTFRSNLVYQRSFF